jgi:hypothetical protein
MVLIALMGVELRRPHSIWQYIVHAAHFQWQDWSRPRNNAARDEHCTIREKKVQTAEVTLMSPSTWAGAVQSMVEFLYVSSTATKCL